MHLIEYIDYEIKPTEELFLIKPFRELFFSDKTEHKDNFLEIISFIYHYVDPRSSYSYITDDDARYEEILKGEGIKNFKITKEIASLIEVYKKRIITTSVLLLQDTKYAVDNFRKFLREIDLNALDDKGRPKYSPDAYARAIEKVPQMAKNLAEAERIVAKEIEEEGRARGGNETKALFEDDMD